MVGVRLRPWLIYEYVQHLSVIRSSWREDGGTGQAGQASKVNERRDGEHAGVGKRIFIIISVSARRPMLSKITPCGCRAEGSVPGRLVALANVLRAAESGERNGQPRVNQLPGAVSS